MKNLETTTQNVNNKSDKLILDIIKKLKIKEDKISLKDKHFKTHVDFITKNLDLSKYTENELLSIINGRCSPKNKYIEKSVIETNSDFNTSRSIITNYEQVDTSKPVNLNDIYDEELEDFKSNVKDFYKLGNKLNDKKFAIS